MIALIVPREEAGAAGGLPHFGLAAGVGLVRSLRLELCFAKLKAASRISELISDNCSA
ncbi:hypothetical protein [Tychonema sp. BBK16]|uniref:hypothetical protein n=1 Tax=Tychonema sp. BBK16 TaxID=2699888 RepID=UPI001F1968FC|nr:hypothetical protein [Tychonema sp. BBK16]MCF6374920.1 hypothetical protein [Tychonema sp. BBK16]